MENSTIAAVLTTGIALAFAFTIALVLIAARQRVKGVNAACAMMMDQKYHRLFIMPGSSATMAKDISKRCNDPIGYALDEDRRQAATTHKAK